MFLCFNCLFNIHYMRLKRQACQRTSHQMNWLIFLHCLVSFAIIWLKLWIMSEIIVMQCGNSTWWPGGLSDNPIVFSSDQGITGAQFMGLIRSMLITEVIITYRLQWVSNDLCSQWNALLGDKPVTKIYLSLPSHKSLINWRLQASSALLVICLSKRPACTFVPDKCTDLIRP